MGFRMAAGWEDGGDVLDARGVLDVCGVHAFGDEDLGEALGAEGGLVGEGGVHFAVDEVGARGLGAEGGDELEEFGFVGVAGEAINFFDMGAEWDLFAEDGDLVPVILNFAAQRGLGLVAGEEDGVARVADLVFEVMEDAAAFAHAAGGDDDPWAGACIEVAAFIAGLDVGEIGKIEGLGEGAGFIIHEHGKVAEDFCEVVGERGVDEDGEGIGNFLLQTKLVQCVYERLCAAEGECGDHEDAVAGDGVVDDAGEGFGDLGHGLVGFAAVGAFGDQQIGSGEGLGIFEHGAVGAADIAAEDDGFAGGGFADGDAAGAQDVAGVVEFDGGAAEVERGAVLERFEQADAVLSVCNGIKRIDMAAAEVVLVEIRGVFFLNFGGIHEH